MEFLPALVLHQKWDQHLSIDIQEGIPCFMLYAEDILLLNETRNEQLVIWN